jgi:uncharacterized protein
MDCPRCQAQMETITHEQVEVDRCTGCGGLWFDLLEHEQLRDAGAAAQVDTGAPAGSPRVDDAAEISCPRCKAPLLHMVDAEQSHIWYESCRVCYGVFFDAGEFKDYSEKSISDIFRTLFKRERK